MALIEELNSQGNWLFKRRSFLPMLLFIPGIALFVYQKMESPIANSDNCDLMYLGVGILGLLIRSFTVGFTPKGTSGRNTTEGQVAEELNTTGIYSTVRHPLYLGNLLMWLSPILIINNHWFTIVFLLTYWIYYERIMFAEEFFIRNKFGKAYDDWAENTPPFFPRLKNYTKSTLTFSFRNVLKREYNGFFNLVMIFIIFKVIEGYVVTEGFHLAFLWKIIFAVTAVVFIVLRTLKKTTKILEVEGR
ncbi:MAG: protein-S-isoprenylcysteine O-methyltransferase Ste14 [Sphingobacteriales bacterium]|jgi:protein-S-isoprenylcysteine O-methyltransferase Ste14